MKRTTAIILTLFLTGLIDAAPLDLEQRTDCVKLQTSSVNSLNLAFDLSKVEIKPVDVDGVQRESILIPGEGFTYVKGMPILPSVSRMVVVPPDAGLKLNVEADEPTVMHAARPPVICDEQELQEPSLEARRAGPGGLYPAQFAEMSEPFIIRGVRLVQVTTYPVQYDPMANTYLHREHIDASIEFTDAEAVNPVAQPVRRHRSRTFMNFISGIAINGDQVGRDDPDYNEDPPFIGHYLCVIPAQNVRFAAPFFEWRRKAGYKVEILALAGNDLGSVQGVKNRIQERYNAYVNEGEDPFDYIAIIGDHASYEGTGTGQQGITIPSPRGNPIWGNHEHYDWEYAKLEGNDEFADVGFSRIPAGNEDMLRLHIGRTLSYEMTPFMDNPAWFTRAAVYSQYWAGNWHVSLNINARWAKEVMDRVGYTDVRMQENITNPESGGQVVGPFLERQFNDGVAMMAGRAENYYWRQGFNNINNNNVFPIDIDIAGHHEWTCWWMLRSWDGQRMKGPVAASTGWGGQQTLPYSVCWMEAVNGFMLRDLPYGWARIQSLVGPTTYIPQFWQSYNQLTTDIVFYGDPGIQAWRGVPRVVTAEVPEEITRFTRRVDVRVVMDDDDENPVAGARVTVYAPGNIPAVDNANYPAYDDMQMWTKLSDENGIATFVFGEDAEFVANTRMYFTVTGRDIRPILTDKTIGTPDAALEIHTWELTDEQGLAEPDGIPNPGEQFSLNITAKNLGDSEDLENVIAFVSTSSPWITLDQTEVEFGAVPAGEEVAGNVAVPFTVSPSCPDGLSRPITRPVIDVEFHSGERVWKSAIKLEPEAPNWEVRSVIGGIIVPAEATEKDIEIINVGSLSSAPATAHLRSAGMGVTVVEDEGTYASLGPNRSARLANNGRFLLSGNRVVVPGWRNQMLLILEDDNGFIDTASFQLQVLQPRQNAPQGPDAYGYICFDDTDDDWDMAPDYNWVEIDPRDEEAEFDGTAINFPQPGASRGSTRGLQLPFETQFYGIVYNRISVSNNGFISMGTQDTIQNFQNWPMDRAIGGGVGMIAPLWDELALGQSGRVYTFYDEEDSRFIIEWSRLRHAIGGQNDLIFQVILYDRRVWITETGDQNILFQYRQVSDVQGTANNWANEVPYASIGISSPHGNTGINYRWNNAGPVTSAPIENRRALLFSTSPRFRAGDLFGRVSDAATGEGIEGAVVFTEHGFIAFTDQAGDWRINDALAEVPFTIYCQKQGYNDSMLVDMQVEEDGELQILFELLHPEFTISDEALGTALEVNQEFQTPFTLVNTGNGPLTWTAEKRLLGDANAAPWELRRRYNSGQVLEDDRLEGVVFANDMFYVSGAHVSADLDDNLIYILSREGELVGSFPQVNSTRWGYKDLDWDGEFIWAPGAGTVYALTTDGQVATSFEDPLAPTEKIACDRENGVLYLSGTTTDIVRVDRAGNEIGERLHRNHLRIYGLAYWPDDPDGYNLYIVNSPGSGIFRVHKMNTETNDTMFVFNVGVDSSGQQQSAWITNEFDVYSWVMMSIQSLSRDRGGDRIEIHQLDARKDWMDVDVWEGQLQTGEVQDFTLSLNSIGLPDTLFEGEIFFRHNADDGEMRLGISLDIIGPQPPESFSLVTPGNGDTLTALPLHGDTLHLPAVRFAWNSSRDVNVLDRITYRFSISVLDSTISLMTADTSLLLSPDTLALPIWFDQPLIWSVTALSGPDAVPCTESFRLVVIPDDVDRDDLGAPVEFGLGPVYPNPFNSRTTIRFGIDKAAQTTLKLYDISGRAVLTLHEGESKIGDYHIALDANSLPSGVYWLRLESLGRTKIEKVALIR